NLWRAEVRGAPAAKGGKLTPGVHDITAEVGNGFDSARFTYARPLRGLANVQTTKLDSSGALVGANTADDAIVRARLNGKKITHLFPNEGTSRFTRLGANDGLRFGRNKLVLTFFRDDVGTYDREVHKFRISRGEPIAGAGGDRSVASGDGVRLNGGSSLP